MTDVYARDMKILIIRMVDAYGYQIWSTTVQVPAWMVSNVQTEWTNSLSMKAAINPQVETRIEVVLRD